MSLLVPSGSNEVLQPAPSLPPSPTEEDLGGASLWDGGSSEEEVLNAHANGLHHHSLGNGSSSGSMNLKGKERARVISLDEGEVTPTFEIDGGYPPLKDEEEESRKVEENLRRLEEEERQRRKAARENAASTAPNSVVSDVSRRASVLLSSTLRRSGSGRRTARTGSGGDGGGRVGTRIHHVHSQLGQCSEDALPLNDLVSPLGSKPSSPMPDARGPVPVPTIVENPFEPPDSATPLCGFQQDSDGMEMSSGSDSGAVMRPSSLLTPSTAASPGEHPRRPPSSFSRPQPAPPPLPLDLPPPKTPPPRIDTPGGTPVISSPPQRASAPSTTRTPTTHNGELTNGGEDEKEHRWWTDWLCGCREEKDRDNAGRTNPFE